MKREQDQGDNSKTEHSSQVGYKKSLLNGAYEPVFGPQSEFEEGPSFMTRGTLRHKPTDLYVGYTVRHNYTNGEIVF